MPESRHRRSERRSDTLHLRHARGRALIPSSHDISGKTTAAILAALTIMFRCPANVPAS